LLLSELALNKVLLYIFTGVVPLLWSLQQPLIETARFSTAIIPIHTRYIVLTMPGDAKTYVKYDYFT